MKDIPAQIHNVKKTTMNDVIISFRVDGMYAYTCSELFQTNIGTEFVMKLEKVDTTTVLGDPSQHDAKSPHERLWGKMHALINLYANKTGIYSETIKDKLKEELKGKGLMNESTKELNLKGLAIACNLLEEWIKE